MTKKTALAKVEKQELQTQNFSDYSGDQIATIKASIMPAGSTDTELQLFVMQCKRTGLDPFSRQIYATKIGGKLSVQATIDGFRLIAERSQKYQGQTIPLFLKEDGVTWTEVWLEKGFPKACKVGVRKAGFTEPLYAIAKWDSYVQQTANGVGFMWKKMPEVMLAKVAEALALRKAFPNDLSGIYSQEEMEQAKEDKPLTFTSATVIEGDTTPFKEAEKGSVVIMPADTVVSNVSADIDMQEPTFVDTTVELETNTVKSEFFLSVEKNIQLAINTGNIDYLSETAGKIMSTTKLKDEEKNVLLKTINGYMSKHI